MLTYADVCRVFVFDAALKKVFLYFSYYFSYYYSDYYSYYFRRLCVHHSRK